MNGFDEEYVQETDTELLGRRVILVFWQKKNSEKLGKDLERAKKTGDQ